MAQLDGLARASAVLNSAPSPPRIESLRVSEIDSRMATASLEPNADRASILASGLDKYPVPENRAIVSFCQCHLVLRLSRHNTGKLIGSDHDSVFLGYLGLQLFGSVDFPLF